MKEKINQDKNYRLVDTSTGRVVNSQVRLNRQEVSTINYAYALNGKSLRYQPK